MALDNLSLGDDTGYDPSQTGGIDWGDQLMSLADFSEGYGQLLGVPDLLGIGKKAPSNTGAANNAINTVARGAALTGIAANAGSNSNGGENAARIRESITPDHIGSPSEAGKIFMGAWGTLASAIPGPAGAIFQGAYGVMQGKDPLDSFGDALSSLGLSALGLGPVAALAGQVGKAFGVYNPDQGLVTSIHDAYKVAQDPAKALPRTMSGVAMFEHEVNNGFRSGGNTIYDHAAAQANSAVKAGQIGQIGAVSMANTLASRAAGYTAPTSGIVQTARHHTISSRDRSGSGSDHDGRSISDRGYSGGTSRNSGGGSSGGHFAR